jgi:hypothetical protein
MRRSALALATALLLAGAARAAGHPEMRCGWRDNPTPQNYWLRDRQGEWTLFEQGGYVADGFDAMPDMSTRGVVATNGTHGYSCACITGVFDAQGHLVKKVIEAEPRPLRQCRADRRLPRM